MGTETEFNVIQFEKKLTALKDSQESINACCQWCLENKQHHKKIVTTWLNVLKRVKIEQRLTLFYLANDVIQYSKRKNYDFVESWGTALQKATTMVRDEKVKHKILRIFKIWEQRSIYGEEFITDLSGLISVSPSSKKIDESHEFQPNYLITKIRNCAKLESDTDAKLTLFKQHNPNLLDCDAVVASLKDRAHVDDVEKEMEDYVTHMEQYVNALKLEIKARNSLINLLLSANTQLEKDRKDVKVVAVAYKSFATRVKNLKKKLDEKKSTLSSPIPSPDVNAPSPSPDSDIELPENDSTKNFAFTNPGFYNPVSTTINDNTNYSNNGYSSFMGSNMPFNMQNINTTNLFNNHEVDANSASLASQTHTTDSSYAQNSIASLFPSIIQPPPPPAPVPPVTTNYQYNTPLAPPPLPPFTQNESSYVDFNTTQTTNYDAYSSYSYTGDYTSENFNQSATTTTDSGYQPYDPYNPEEEPETWENDGQWDQPPHDMDTPASPPLFDKQSYVEPIEYHERQDILTGVDVDHRVLNLLTKNKSDMNHKKKDVDHRNLISLIGSPKETSETSQNSMWSVQGDQDYRSVSKDTDYRTDTSVPPPPPLLKKLNMQSPRKLQDNVESIDMELSDDELEGGPAGLLPPPPFLEDAHNFFNAYPNEKQEDLEQWSNNHDMRFRGRGGKCYQTPLRGEFNNFNRPTENFCNPRGNYNNDYNRFNTEENVPPIPEHEYVQIDYNTQPEFTNNQIVEAEEYFKPRGGRGFRGKFPPRGGRGGNSWMPSPHSRGGRGKSRPRGRGRAGFHTRPGFRGGFGEFY